MTAQSEPFTQLPLYSSEAEAAVIGATLINPDCYVELAGFLQAGHFHVLRHRWIWEAVVRLQENRTPVDFLTVTADLDCHGRLEEVGGPAYITTLINNVPTSLHAAAYGQLVAENARRRKLLEAAGQIARLVYQKDMGFGTVLDESERAVFAISQESLGSHMRPIAQVVGEVYEQASELAGRKDSLPGISTGFTDLDEILKGLQPSDLVLVAGRPGQGKTGLLLSLVRNAAQQHGTRVAVFTLEMSAQHVVLRLLSQESGIDGQKLRCGQLHEDEWPRVAQAMETISLLPVYLDDTPALTPGQLRSACRKLRLEYGLDLVVVDYLQLMSGGNGTRDQRFESRQQEVSYISRQLKALARELNVPVLAAAQLSRAVEQRAVKTPVLSDLRESGSLEMDADVVAFIHRPELYAPEDPLLKGIAQISVAKHRNGPLGSVELVFRRELARFDNANAITVDLNQGMPI